MKSWIIAVIVLQLVGLTVAILNKTMDGWMTATFFSVVSFGVYWIFERRKEGKNI